MIYLILGAIIVLIAIAIIVYFILGSVLNSININVERQGNDTILNISSGIDIRNLVITVTPGIKKSEENKKIVLKRKLFVKNSEPIRITYKIPVKKIWVSYTYDGKRERWNYEK